jgi:hypothetical protein
MVVAREALAVVSGETVTRTYRFGEKTRRARLCPHCDTRLWAEPEDRADIALLLPGTLDQAADFSPVAHIWTRGAPAWYRFPPSAMLFDTQPDDKHELVRLWAAASAVAPGAD